MIHEHIKLSMVALTFSIVCISIGMLLKDIYDDECIQILIDGFIFLGGITFLACIFSIIIGFLVKKFPKF